MLTFILLTVFAASVWAIVAGIRSSKNAAPSPLNSQALSALALPYRSYLGEAVSIHTDMLRQAENAPKQLQGELFDFARRIEHFISRAVPRAKHGTQLQAYLLELNPDEPQYAVTKAASEELSEELAQFVAHLRTLRGKVYQVLTNANELSKDKQLARDLDNALLDIEALETAFGELEPLS